MSVLGSKKCTSLVFGDSYLKNDEWRVPPLCPLVSVMPYVSRAPASPEGEPLGFTCVSASIVVRPAPVAPPVPVAAPVAASVAAAAVAPAAAGVVAVVHLLAALRSTQRRLVARHRQTRLSTGEVTMKKTQEFGALTVDWQTPFWTWRETFPVGSKITCHGDGDQNKHDIVGRVRTGAHFLSNTRPVIRWVKKPVRQITHFCSACSLL